MHFDQLTPDHGLSQSSVISIEQDARGVMWFGTENGLNRYNGYEFEQFRQQRGSSHGLKSDFVYDIANAQDGGLWIATNGGGLAKLDARSGQIESWRHDPANPASIAGDIVRTVLVDSHGAVWLGLRNAGLDRFDPRTETFTHYRLADEAGGESVYALHEDASGMLWVGGEKGLYRLDPAEGAFTAFRHNPQDATTLSDDRIRSIYEDSNGNLWFGTYAGGLNRLDRETGEFSSYRHDADDSQSLSDDRVTAILEDRTGRLWVATSRGLNLYDAAADGFARYRHSSSDAYSLGSDAVTSLFEDRSGILWVGTLTHGISKWNPRTWELGYQSSKALATSEASKPNITAFAKSTDNTLYIGTFGDGLIAKNQENDTVTHYRHDPENPASLSDDRIMSLALDRAGKLWIGTMTGGLNYFDPVTGDNQVFRHNATDPASLSADGIMSVFAASDGKLWIGTFGGGISVIEPGTDEFTRYTPDASAPGTLSSSRITSFAEDRSGMLWIGTDAGGLNLYNPTTGQFHVFRSHIDDPQSLASDTVYALHVDARGDVWVGTRGGGLDKVVGDVAQPGDIRFENVSQQDGLTNDVIYGIQSDATGRLWLSTNFGISLFDPADGSVKNMHRRDGLQSEEFNFGAHHRGADGQLYFGGVNGFNVFHPDRIEARQSIPPVILSGFYKSNDPVKADLPHDLDDGLELTHRDDRVSFEFAALDYAAPQQNRYKYRLEGFDEDWIDLGNRRRVTYTDLNDGHYVLRVQAANSGGVWNETGLALPITVRPALWDTWWAYSLYAAAILLLAGAVWRAHQNRVRREEAYSLRLEEEVRLRSAKLAERNRELKEINQLLEKSSLSDPLTGLRNRRFVFEEVSKDLKTISRKYSDEEQGVDPSDSSDLVFMMIDLDNFKPINDTYGHAAGDQLLLDIRDVLLETCRESDFVVRWGGDEFVVIARQSHKSESEALAEKIRNNIAERAFELQDGQVIRTTCSIGFVAYPLYHGHAKNADLDDVINLADCLMYEAKRQRNAWVGMLGINEAVTSCGFDVETVDTSSVLFRARREGRIFEHAVEGTLARADQTG